VSATEETLERLQQFEQELLALRGQLRKAAIKVKGRNSSSHHSSSHSSGGDNNDSGISDASSSSCSSINSSMELDFPLRQQQMDRLRFLAQHLQQSLQPSSKVVFLMLTNLAGSQKKLLQSNLEQIIS
jgi:hypothetical protein